MSVGCFLPESGCRPVHLAQELWETSRGFVLVGNGNKCSGTGVWRIEFEATKKINQPHRVRSKDSQQGADVSLLTSC